MLRQALAIALSCVVTHSAYAAGEVNVYSLRQAELIKPLFDQFTKESGIKVNVVFAKEGLVERLKSEGANSPADLLLTTDISRLEEAVEAGVAQSVKSSVLESNIPAQYRDAQGQWFGLTQRARVIVTSKERVKPDAISSYADLAQPQWKGKICVRSAKHVYNAALISALLSEQGAEKTEQWLSGFKANLARKPQGGDRDQIKAIKEGLCDVALVNTYYIAGMLSEPEQAAAAQAVNVIFPDQNAQGTHVNISGVVLTKGAPNKANAIKLMEFLSGDEAQRLYAEQNFEYPVKPGVAWSGALKTWGEFKADPLPLMKIAEQRVEASKLVDKVGFDN